MSFWDLVLAFVGWQLLKFFGFLILILFFFVVCLFLPAKAFEKWP